MAYSKDLGPCHEPGCGKTPKCEVFGSRNESYGLFCTAHGKRRVKIMNQKEPKTRVRDDQIKAAGPFLKG